MEFTDLQFGLSAEFFCMSTIKNSQKCVNLKIYIINKFLKLISISFQSDYHQHILYEVGTILIINLYFENALLKN